MRALTEAFGRLKTSVYAAPSRLRKLAKGEGEAGTRAFPPQTGKNDETIGVRLDWGSKFLKDGVEYIRIQLQINKQAANSTLKALAAKDSHKVWAEADIPVNPTPEDVDAVAKKAFDDLEEGIKRSPEE